MGTANYATDAYSTVGGLAAVAYGDPEYFREVKNQIFSISPTKSIDLNLPSSIISGLFGEGDKIKNHIKSALQELGSEPSNFKDWIDVIKDRIGGEGWASNLASKIEAEFFSGFDNNNQYYKSLEEYIDIALSNISNVSIPSDLLKEVSEKIARILRSDSGVGPDIDEMIAIVNNNPLTKLDKVPPDTILPLSTSVSLSNDYRGVPFETAYLTPGDYFSEVAYPKTDGSSFNLSSTLKDSAKFGYKGYSPYSLEALFNPELAENMSDMVKNMLPSVMEQLQYSSNSILSKQDRDIYNISLMAIDLAGYTSFDPSTLSNGDSLDIALLPRYDETNSDSGSGNLPLSREKTTAFI